MQIFVGGLFQHYLVERSESHSKASELAETKVIKPLYAEIVPPHMIAQAAVKKSVGGLGDLLGMKYYRDIEGL